jgi:hypothetical protein
MKRLAIGQPFFLAQYPVAFLTGNNHFPNA